MRSGGACCPHGPDGSEQQNQIDPDRSLPFGQDRAVEAREQNRHPSPSSFDHMHRSDGVDVRAMTRNGEFSATGITISTFLNNLDALALVRQSAARKKP
jgi:hypothetical protein